MWKSNGTATGTVLSNGLEEVTVDVKGSTRKIDSQTVQRVVFGQVPAAFRDGEAYSLRGDFENAASSFRLAAHRAVWLRPQAGANDSRSAGANSRQARTRSAMSCGVSR